ncbi:MAG: PKD domain-containing protein, partial [Salinivirgaceae bacterium]|nr:PKD domain-containing protein [Salinivirgaceae bacterium]
MRKTKLIIIIVFISSLKIYSQSLPIQDRLSLWLNASEQVTLNDTLVSDWGDKSSNGYIASQVTSSNQPWYIENFDSLNNNAILRFDNDYLTLGNFIPIDSIREVFMLYRQEKFVNYPMVLSKGYSVNGAFSIGTNGNTHKPRLYADGQIVASTLDADFNNPGILKARIAPSSEFNLSINTQTYLSTTPSVDLIGSNAYDFRIGNSPQGNTYYFNGYIAEIIIYDTLLSPTQENQVYSYLQNKYAPAVDLASGISADHFGDTAITAYKPWFTNYNWSTGSTDSAITISKAGKYFVTVTDYFGFESEDSITVNYPQAFQLSDTTICLYDTLIWDTGLTGNYTYNWSTGETTPSLKIFTPGSYNCTITDSKSNDSILLPAVISIDSFGNDVWLGDSYTVCSGESIGLQSSTSEVTSYLWSTSSTDSAIIITATGEYHVTATNTHGCEGVDTTTITVNGVAPYVGFIFDTVCFGEGTNFQDTSIEGEIGDPILSRQWNFGNGMLSSQSDTSIIFATDGTQNVCLTVTSTSGCENTICKSVLVKPLPPTSFVINQGSLHCLNTPVTFIDTNNYLVAFDFRLWNFGDGSSASDDTVSHIYTSESDFDVTLKLSLEGCIDSTSQTVTISSTINIEDISLLSPPDNLVHSSDSLTFNWASSENALNYEVLVSADADFGSLLIDTITIDTLVKLPISPLYDTVFWQVRAYNLCNEYIHSATRKLMQFPQNSRLSLWLDASAGITLNDTLVSYWADQSTYTRDGSQGDNTRQPEFIPSYSGLNNQPALLFDQDYLSFGNTLPVDSIRQLFIIFQHNAFSNYSMFLSKGYTGNGSFSLGTNNNNPTPQFYIDGATFSSPTAIDKSTPSVLSVRLNPLNSISATLNGQNIISTTTALDLIGSNAYDFRIGNNAQTNTYYFNGYIAEIIIYDTLLSPTQEN